MASVPDNLKPVHKECQEQYEAWGDIHGEVSSLLNHSVKSRGAIQIVPHLLLFSIKELCPNCGKKQLVKAWTDETMTKLSDSIKACKACGWTGHW